MNRAVYTLNFPDSQFDLPVIFHIINNNPPQIVSAELAFFARKLDYVVRINVAVLWDSSALHDTITRIGFDTSDEPDFPFGHLSECQIVVVGSIHSHPAVFRKQSGMLAKHGLKGLAVMFASVRNFGKNWNQPIMVKSGMNFYGPFPMVKFGPGKQGKAQVDCRRVNAQKLALESLWFAFAAYFWLKPFHHDFEHVPIDFP